MRKPSWQTDKTWSKLATGENVRSHVERNHLFHGRAAKLVTARLGVSTSIPARCEIRTAAFLCDWVYGGDNEVVFLG